MNFLTQIKDYFTYYKDRAEWSKRNDQIALFLDSTSVKYFNFQQDYFLNDTLELRKQIQDLGFKQCSAHYLIDIVQDDLLSFTSAYKWDKYNIVVHLVDKHNMTLIEQTHKILKKLKYVNDAISVRDFFIASLTVFQNDK